MSTPFDVYDEMTTAELARDAAELEAARAREAWRAVMSTIGGRYVVRSLLAFLAPHSASALDHASLAYREGQRSVALLITDAVRTHAPEHFPTLFEDKPHE